MSRIDSDGSYVVVTDPKKPLDVAISTGNVTIEGPVTVSNEVEISNDDNSPIPVAGTVRNALLLRDVTPPLDTNIYASGDVLFIPVAASMASANGGHGLLHSLAIVDKDDNGGALDLVFLSGTATSFGSINSAVAIDDADAEKILGIVSISSGDYKDLGGSKIVTLTNIGLTLKAESTGTNVYIAGISRDTKTYTGTGLNFRLGIAALD